MSNILDKIVLDIKKNNSIDFEGFDPDVFELYSRPRPIPLSFKNFFTIAEVKHASPSKGIIRDPFDPISIAQDYIDNGANAISVLTEINYFKGASQHLKDIRNISSLPLLRKDFIFHPYQVFETFNMGADILLLIVAILDRDTLLSLKKLAEGLGLTVLIEIHNKEELDIALSVEPSLLGINNRNLKTFEVSLQTSLDLYPKIPKGINVISESGIAKKEDVELLKANGFNGILVGESLLREMSPGKALKNLLNND